MWLIKRSQKMTHKLQPLPYEYDALEPYIDEKTMRIHHTRHHQTYIDKLNAAINDYPELQNDSAEDLIKKLDTIPDGIRSAVRNHGGGHANHSFFWSILKKDVPFAGEVASSITNKYDSYDNFKNEFSTKAALLFGSGWTWLVLVDGKLDIMTTPDQDSPLTINLNPILGLDVWEHA
jgi:Fe-Mn family superoxide dismutase